MGGGRKNQRGGHRLCPQKAGEQYRESSLGGGHLAMPSSLPGQRGVGRHSTSEAAQAVATLCPSAEQEVYGREGLAGGELTWAVGPNLALQIPFSDLFPHLRACPFCSYPSAQVVPLGGADAE